MDKFEVLRKYKSLLEEGIIDQAEFDAKKKQILAMDDSTDNNEVLINVKDDVPLDNTIEKLVDSKETIQVAEFIPIEDGPSEEELEAIKKNQIYDEALKKLSCNSYKQHSEAIIELEKLGDWRDSEELLEKSKEEVVELEKIEKEKAAEIERVKQAKRKKIKKVLKIAGIAVGIILALFIALIIIANALTPDISEDEKTKKAEINGITYEMPVSWEKLEEESSDSFHRYIKEDEKEVIAVADIEYTGEEDLTSGDAAYQDEHPIPDGTYDILADCEGTYQEVNADSSVFQVTVYIVPGMVKGESEFLSWIVGSFTVDTYENPRKSLGVEATYSGSTKAGVKIDSDCEDISVVETFETVLGEGSKDLDWTIETPVTLAAGKTSSVVLKIGDREKTMKVTCTDMTEAQYKAKCVSRNYKNQLRDASYGEYIKIYGQVLQDCGLGMYRISSSGGYDDVYMVYALGSDIVEDDWVTIYGVTDGIYSYETVLGASKKIPSIDAKYVER